MPQYSTPLIHSWPAHAVCVSAMSVNQIWIADKAEGENGVYVRSARKRCKSTVNALGYEAALQLSSVDLHEVLRWPTHNVELKLKHDWVCFSISNRAMQRLMLSNRMWDFDFIRVAREAILRMRERENASSGPVFFFYGLHHSAVEFSILSGSVKMIHFLQRQLSRQCSDKSDWVIARLKTTDGLHSVTVDLYRRTTGCVSDNGTYIWSWILEELSGKPGSERCYDPDTIRCVVWSCLYNVGPPWMARKLLNMRVCVRLNPA